MQSRQYTANVPLPSKLNVSDGCLNHYWKKFKCRFLNYRVVSRLDKEPNEFQSAVFLAIVGEDAMDILIFDGFKFEQEADMQDLGKIRKSLKIFVSVKHTKRMNRTSFISDVKNRQKQSKRTFPLCVSWQRTVTLEFLRTEWYKIKLWWVSGKMRFENSCWRIKNSTWQNVWS